MKKIIFISFIFLSILSKAQQGDSIKIKLNHLIESNTAIKNDLNEVKLNLRQCHEVYRAGLWISLIGSGITSFGAFKNEPGIIYSGSAIMVVGCGAIIYSHTFIGKAGISISTNSVKYSF